MKGKMTTPLMASLGAVVLMVTLFLSFYFSTSAYRSNETSIVLPGESTDVPVIPEHGDDETEQQVLKDVTVTAENAQEVISSLLRPSAYSYTVQNTLYLGDGSNTLTRKQYVKDGACRTDELSAGGVVLRSAVRYGEKTYAWENGASSYYAGSAGNFSADADAMLPTYETVLSLPKESILEAGLTNLNYEPCIYISTSEDAYSGLYYISAVSGLLVRADISEGEALLRRCVVSSLSTLAPADSYFTLPGGASVFDLKDE